MPSIGTLIALFISLYNLADQEIAIVEESTR
jgi:hypothetical protein